MISIMCSRSRLCMVVLVFYTCIWIPFFQLKNTLLKVLGFVFPWYIVEESICCQQQVNVCLPVARFEDLKLGEAEAEVCSICLVEFEKEDIVSQLQRCKHVFHMNCIEKWLEIDQFTCPLCRSFLFATVNPSHARCGTSTNPPTSSHLISSWLSF